MIHLRGMKSGFGAGSNPFPAANAQPYSLNTDSPAEERGETTHMTSGKRKRPGGKKRSLSAPDKTPKLSDSMGAGSRAGESSRLFTPSSTPKRGFPQKRY